MNCDHCKRPATSYLEDGTPLCKGHRIMADANYEWHAQRLDAKRWLEENPEPEEK